MVVGAAVASIGAESTTTAEAGPETTADLPAIRDLRLNAADNASRSRSGASTGESGESGDDAAEPQGGPSPDAESSPTSNPVPTQEAAVTAAPVPPRFEPVPGCDAVVPQRGEVANGYLSDEYLCPTGSGHWLRPDAAAAFLALADAYEADGGGSLVECITDSYRSYQQQVDLKARKPYLAAAPGTSNHGWGIAVDLECGANSYGSSLYNWLMENGDEFDWENPAWAQATGSKPEPWHWEYRR